MTRHALAVVALGSDRRMARCSCGWRSPVVVDRRTAVQAWAAHRDLYNRQNNNGGNP